MRRFLATCALLGLSGAAAADPWLTAGDAGLRHDIQLLADAGLLRGPVTTWPMSWPDIARDALSANADASLSPDVLSALLRIQRAARAAAAQGFSGIGLRASAASDSAELRTFSDSPREEGEVAAKASWLGNRIALNAQATVVTDPADGKQVRADGSYLGVNIGNFMISAGYMERWWGPGWEGSLILSTNARPIPSLTLERNYTDPFKTKLLSWIGHWRASIAVGEAEGSDVALPNVRFLAARVNFKPRPWLEFGLTRTAQWCGGERVCDFGTFRDLLIGQDNVDDSLSAADQPGNQLAGYDARVRSPWHALPLAFYTQWIGEDEAGGLPSKFMGLFGGEWWGSMANGSLRVHVEYADTACSFSRQEPEFGCAYRNGVYPQGYTHRRRIIGHAMDNDSRMWSLGALYTTASGTTIEALVRMADLNRDGGDHAIIGSPADLNNVEFRYSRVFGFGKMTVGLAYDDLSGPSRPDNRSRGFVSWQQGF
jgi:hypothetical protein